MIREQQKRRRRRTDFEHSGSVIPNVKSASRKNLNLGISDIKKSGFFFGPLGRVEKSWFGSRNLELWKFQVPESKSRLFDFEVALRRCQMISEKKLVPHRTGCSTFFRTFRKNRISTSKAILRPDHAFEDPHDLIPIFPGDSLRRTRESPDPSKKSELL